MMIEAERLARKGKLEKYSELGQFPNVIQVNELSVSPLVLSEQWDPARSGAGMPLVIEVGCGTAEHTMAMASEDPTRFFIGIDVKGNRLWQGARRALDGDIQNALFIRMRAEYLAEYFPAASISEIWVTFPDPHLKRSLKSASKRLTSPGFIDLYRKILLPGGIVHVKTDNNFFYEHSMRNIVHSGGMILHTVEDLHGCELPATGGRMTSYERKYIRENRKIRYIKFGF